MIIRAKDFELRTHPLIADPEASQEFKEFFSGLGLAESTSRAEGLEIVDECFKCGKKLTTPYIYWNGGMGTLSLHPLCAADLSHGLAQDAFEVSKGRPPVSGREAAKWLDLFASKKEYGIEDEEFPQTISEAEAA